MTLESRINKNRYIGNGATTDFPFTFRVWKEDQVLVFVGDGRIESEVASSCEISLSETGGTVSFPTPPESGKIIAIRRSMPYIQEDDYQNGSRYNGEEVEDRFDQDCAERQDLRLDVDSCIRLPETSDGDPSELASDLFDARDRAETAADAAESAQTAAESAQAAAESAQTAAEEARDAAEAIVDTGIIADGSTTPRRIAERFADAVWPEDFGAAGDGVTDDTAALQAAIDAAAGKPLRLRGVSYLCATDRLYIRSLTHMYGESGSRIVRGYERGSSGAASLVLVSPLTGEDTIYDIVLDGITFDGNGGVYGENGFDIIYMSTLPTSNVVIRNCTFKDVVHAHAVDMARCNGVLIDGCRFEGWKILESATEEWAKDKREAIQLDGYDVNDTANRNRNITVRNCWFGASDTEGFGPWPAGVGNHGWFDSSETCRDIIIEDNFFDSLTYFGVTCLAWKNVKIIGNTFKNCSGVSVIARNNASDSSVNAVPEKIVIANNIINGIQESSKGVYIWISSGANPSESAIFAGLPKDVTIANNIISSCKEAIDAKACYRLKIDSNNFSNDTTTIIGNVVGYVSINNNTMANCGSVSLCVTASGYATSAGVTHSFSVCGNVFRSLVGKGIHITGDARHAIISDNLFTAAAETGETRCYIESDVDVIDCSVVNNIAAVSSTTRENAFKITNARNRQRCFNNRFVVNGVDTFGYDFSPSVRLEEANYSIHAKKDSDPYFRGSLGFFEGDTRVDGLTFTDNAGSTYKSLIVGPATGSSTSINRLKFCADDAKGVYCNANGHFYPAQGTGQTMGSSSNPWANVYATTGPWSGSDARLKQDIESAPEALMRAWSRVRFKVFRMKDAVAEKGDGARMHIGVVAQEVQAAFAEEGLDAGRYGLYGYDEWQDEYEEVAVVDRDAVYDAEGNMLSKPQTHIERKMITHAGNKYSIRYEEALALECAYQRWRLEQLEERINHLTSNS